MFKRIKKNVRQMRANRSASQESSESNSSGKDTSAIRGNSSSSPANDHEMKTVADYLNKVDELAAFAACVETSDALAASSPYTTSSAKYDKDTGLTDCSVLVSPDGDLLLLPNEPDGGSAHKESQDEETNDSESNEALADSVHAERLNHLGGEFESAVFMGNDLRTGGDKAVNGFSAMGWAPSATSLAIRQSEESMRNMASFVEDIMLIRKEGAARASQACDKLRTHDGGYFDERENETPPSSRRFFRKGSSAEKEGSKSDRPTGEFDLLPDGDGVVPWQVSGGENNNAGDGKSTTSAANRVGPLQFSGGTIQAATQALEQYHSLMSENDADRWRMASMSNFNSGNSKEGSKRSPTVGVLPALRKAADQTADRAYKREKALRDMQRRVDAIDARLAQCKEESKRRWEAVHDAEERVTRIVEERMLERSRQREKLRMEQLRETYAEEEDNPQLGATPNEIWDLVSAVAESMEGGSFEPTGLPQASIGGPLDKTLKQRSYKERSGDPAEVGHDPTAATPFPLASRCDIEEECNLPTLRAAAMAADEAIEDAAGSLLNVLSTLDTNRRSARIAAETCLLSTANAQAKCIRSLIALERASIEDRLRNIEELERIASNIDVRADLDAYISADKKERGGATWLGEDDDGGVASALAVLSSHVEGSMGYTPSSKLMTEGWDQSEYDEEFSAEAMEDAVELLFDSKALESEDEEKRKSAGEAHEKSVQLLCTVAADAESMQSRSLRSTICYAINQKRSSNAELQGHLQFDALCRVFDAILTGCDREASGVANAKMCMMLSQTFYMVEDKDDGEASERHERIFIKSRLMEHELWADEEFWDQALYQCVTESLTNSGVMENFERTDRDVNKSEWTEWRKLKWHDLTKKERAEAAAQVHAVVFAQLGALAHSMIEFGCGIERSCAFVRRMAIRNQLPISQRAMLLQHLMDNGGGSSDMEVGDKG